MLGSKTSTQLRFGLRFLFPDESNHDSIDYVAMSVPRPSLFIDIILLLNYTPIQLRFGLRFLSPDEFSHDSIDYVAISVPRPSFFHST
jgi:hypothetical protein